MATAAKHSAPTSTAGVKDAASSPRHPMTSPRQSQLMQQQAAPFLDSPQRSAPPVSASAFQLPAHLRQLGQPVSPGETPVRRSAGGHPSILTAAAAAVASSGIAGPAATGCVGHEVEIRDWSLEDSRQRELEEARNRAAQMEKTMRWWSDCTASWRDKWAKTRNERNKSREEAQQLRQALEQTRRELDAVRRDRDGLLASIGNSPAATGQTASVVQLQPMSLPAVTPTSAARLQTSNRQLNDDSNLIAGCQLDVDNTAEKQQQQPQPNSAVPTSPADPLASLSADELVKRLRAELAERARLERAVAALHAELAAASASRKSRTRTTSGYDEFEDGEDEDEFFEDACSNGTAGAKAASTRIEELQREVERLLAVNASEWSHRERLQAQLGATEREARRLRQELADLRVPSAAVAAVSVDLDDGDCEAAIEAALENDDLLLVKPEDKIQERQPKQRLQTSHSGDGMTSQQRHGRRPHCHGINQLNSAQVLKSQEHQRQLSESRARIGRLERQVRSLSSELAHSDRRCRQYSAETADLRARVEQLKEQLVVVEDELEASNRTVRRLRMANVELTARASQLAGDGSSSPEDALELACYPGEAGNLGGDVGDARRSLPADFLTGSGDH